MSDGKRLAIYDRDETQKFEKGSLGTVVHERGEGTNRILRDIEGEAVWG